MRIDALISIISLMVDWELLKQASLQAVSGGLTPQILAWGLCSGYEGMPVGFRPASHLSSECPTLAGPTVLCDLC